jgi:hypothetical protein
VDPVPGGALDDRLVLILVGDALVLDLADVGPVVQQLVQNGLVERPAALGAMTGSVQLLHQPGGRTDLQEAREDVPDERGFGLINHQLAVVDAIPERRVAAHPHPALAGSVDLVPDSLGRKFSFELCERKQDVQGKPSH